MVLQAEGYPDGIETMASSFASYGTRVSRPQVGAPIAVKGRRGGGHVGSSAGRRQGKPIMTTRGNNNGNRVRRSAGSHAPPDLRQTSYDELRNHPHPSCEACPPRRRRTLLKRTVARPSGLCPTLQYARLSHR